MDPKVIGYVVEVETDNDGKVTSALVNRGWPLATESSDLSGRTWDSAVGKTSPLSSFHPAVLAGQ